MSQKNYRVVRLLLLMFLGLWLVLIMFPFYFQIITSLKDVAEVNRIAPTFWPEVFVFRNYSAIWNEPGNFKSLIDSFIIATGNTILSLFFGTSGGLRAGALPAPIGRRKRGDVDPVEPHVPAGGGPAADVLPVRGAVRHH